MSRKMNKQTKWINNSMHKTLIIKLSVVVIFLSIYFIATFEFVKADGPVSFDKQNITSEVYSSGRELYAADVNGDGHLDVIGRGYPSGLAWWENASPNGDGTSWSTPHPIDTLDRSDVYAINIDGDQDIDVVVADFGNDEIIWWENNTPNGDGTSWTSHTIDGNFDGPKSVYAVDIDNDGDTDVIGAAQAGDEIKWWENNDPTGNGTTWIPHTIDSNFDQPISIYAIDINGDQNQEIDIVGVSLLTGGVVWWENNGTSTPWPKYTIDTNPGGSRGVHAADIDGDQDIDVVSSDFTSDEIIWWENDNLNWSKHVLGPNFNLPQAVFAADIDNDGDSDVLSVSFHDNTISWWDNQGNDMDWNKYDIETNFAGPREALAVDINGDGATDILGATGASQESGIFWWENTSTVGGSISGQVTWTQSGNPIGGVTIGPALGSDPFTAVETDENGDYQILNLSPGNYELAASREGYNFESAADGSDTIQVQITSASVSDQDFVAVSEPPPVIAASHGFKGAGWLRYDDGSEDTDYEDDNIGWNVERVEDIRIVPNLANQIETLSTQENVDTLIRIDTPDATGPIRLRGLDQNSSEYKSNLNQLNQFVTNENCNGIEDWMEDLDQFYLQVIGVVPSVDKFIFANEPNHHRDEWNYTAEQYAFVYNCYYTRWLEHEFEEGVGRRPHALYVAGPGQEPGRTGYQWEHFLPELFNNLDRADGFTMHVYGYDEIGDSTGNTLFKNWLNSIMSNMYNHTIANDKPLVITEYNPGAVVGGVNAPSNGWTDWLERTYCWVQAAQQTYPDVRLRGLIYFVDEPDQWRNHDSNGAWYPVSFFSDNNRRQVWLDLDNDFSGLGYGPSSGNYTQWCLDGSGSLRRDDLTTLYASIGDIELQFKQNSHSPTAQSSPSNQIGGIISGTLGVWGDSTVYYVTDDLEVPAGQTLTIEAGTTLIFSSTQRLTVGGQLEAKGNTVFPVRFTSQAEAGWEGIHFLSSAIGSRCIGCSLENIRPGGVALQVEAPLAFQSSFIRDVPGGTAISSTVPITLSHTVIDYVDTGIYLSGQSNQTHDISHITTTRCEKGVVNRGQILNLDNNIITTCGTAVSTELSGTTAISYTLFDGNGQGFATEVGSNLSQGPGLLNAPADFVDFPNDVTLQADSAAVNAADPQAPFERELGFNGDRADLGAYGNSWRAPQQPPLSQMAVTLVADSSTLTGHPGEIISYTLTLQNSGSVTDTYGVSTQASDLRLTTSFSENNDQEYYFVKLAPQAQISATIWVKIPLTSTLNVSNTILVRAVGHYQTQSEIELTTLIASSFQEENGLVVMEAEHYAANIERSNRDWLTQTTVNGYTGEGYMEALPDTDLQFTAAFTTTSPELNYTINFTTTGVYTVWLRGYAGNAAGDSLFIGLDGQPNFMLTGFDPQEWNWVTDNSLDITTTINITQSGIHKLQLWQREDGFRLDRILLTTDSGYNPTGNGPPESDLR